jgi:septal ring factor EnvC (AmiA/AmiB activator)
MKTNPAFGFKLIRWLFLRAALLPAFCLPLYALPSEPPAPELTRLLEISTRLSELNEQLRNELDGSRRNSTELSAMLEKSRNELERLKAELEPLRNNSTALQTTALRSERELNGLRIALRKAETSLMNLEISYSAYRKTTESQLTQIKKNNRVFRYITIGVSITAIAGWTAFGIASLR